MAEAAQLGRRSLSTLPKEKGATSRLVSVTEVGLPVCPCSETAARALLVQPAEHFLL